MEWLGNGYENRVTVSNSDSIHLTAEPIINHPTPEDSPIVITKYATGDRDFVYCNVVANYEPESATWVIVNQAGKTDWIYGPDILEWYPVVITKTGPGVWDERDKRDRRTKRGHKLAWSEEHQMWVLKTDWRCYYGTLDAIRCRLGDAFLTGFADEQGGEE